MQGAKVKKGQPIAFIEQLGTFVPVEVRCAALAVLRIHSLDAVKLCAVAEPGMLQATHAGEIASFLVDEGQSVEYKQPLVEMYPFFGGHIIGDRKNA